MSCVPTIETSPRAAVGETACDVDATGRRVDLRAAAEPAVPVGMALRGMALRGMALRGTALRVLAPGGMAPRECRAPAGFAQVSIDVDASQTSAPHALRPTRWTRTSADAAGSMTRTTITSVRLRSTAVRSAAGWVSGAGIARVGSTTTAEKN